MLKGVTATLSRESIVLMLICLADMFSTLIFVCTGHAVEHNPIMAACLNRSAALFLVVKTASFVPFIAIIEWYRRRKPVFARLASRTAIVLYLFVYLILCVRVNLMS